VPYQQIMEVLANSDLFVYPTRSEMMPRGVIEAMLAGKPVVASAVDGILDLVETRKTGFLVSAGDVDELANAICELIKNPAFANELGLAGQKFVLEYCSPERVGGLFRDFYQTILTTCSNNR
jgi:glycosyltransferase involved in cell wall biosynthesis